MEKNKQLVDDIQSIVEDIFAKKERAEQIADTEAALQESANMIDKLNNSLEETQSALTQLKETSTEEIETTKEEASREISEKETKISELTEELEAAQKKVEETTNELASVKETLENLQKDQLAEARMKELVAAKVNITNEVEAQTAKVREMSDEDFASYKEERIALRKAVEAELAAATEDATDDTDDTETATEDIDTDDTETPATDIPVGQALASAMNMETTVSNDVKTKYRDLGKAMADAMSKSDK